jgi:transcription elongation factor Elf1
VDASVRLKVPRIAHAWNTRFSCPGICNYERLTQQAVEIKRMLTVLVQKLNAES